MSNLLHTSHRKLVRIQNITHFKKDKITDLLICNSMEPDMIGRVTNPTDDKMYILNH